MKIIIGKLGNQPFKITEPSVSRYHAELEVNELTGKMILRDTDSANGTYIIDNSGHLKRIKEAVVGKETIVRVGATVKFKIKDLLGTTTEVVPAKKEEEVVDISHLKRVYDNYTRNKMDIEAQLGNIMMLRLAALSISGVIMALLSIILPEDMLGDNVTTTLIKALVTLLTMGISWVAVDIKNKGLIRRRYGNEEYYKKKYCCPKCGYFFGTRVYENILAEGKCPNPACKCKFTAKK